MPWRPAGNPRSDFCWKLQPNLTTNVSEGEAYDCIRQRPQWKLSPTAASAYPLTLLLQHGAEVLPYQVVPAVLQLVQGRVALLVAAPVADDAAPPVLTRGLVQLIRRGGALALHDRH